MRPSLHPLYPVALAVLSSNACASGDPAGRPVGAPSAASSGPERETPPSDGSVKDPDGTPTWIRLTPASDDALFAVGKKGAVRNRMLRGMSAKNHAFAQMERRHGFCAGAVVKAWFDAHPTAHDGDEELLVGMAVKGLARKFFGPMQIVEEYDDDDFSFRLARVDRATMRAGVGVAAVPLRTTVVALEAAFDVAWADCKTPNRR